MAFIILFCAMTSGLIGLKQILYHREHRELQGEEERMKAEE